MKRIITFLLMLVFLSVCLYAGKISIIKNDGTIIKGNMIGVTSDTVYVEVTNGMATAVNRLDIKEVFNQDTGGPVDLNMIGSPSSPPASGMADTNNIIEDPDLIVVPGTYVYYYNWNGYDCFFYDGFWWIPWNNLWYESYYYYGGWAPVGPSFVPNNVRHLPVGWKMDIANGPRVGFKDAKANWSGWEKNGYWAGNGWKNGTYRISTSRQLNTEIRSADVNRVNNYQGYSRETYRNNNNNYNNNNNNNYNNNYNTRQERR